MGHPASASARLRTETAINARVPKSLPKLADGATALKQTLQALMAPVARLCLARGLSFAESEELLKRAYVDAAREAHNAVPGQRDISRVSTATGLTRREVTRITNDVAAPAILRPSPATQLFTKWMGSRRLRDKQGRPMALKRQGRAPSFESLAQSITTDVHPRSLLEELRRLGLAGYDEASDTVSLLHEAFVPHEDQSRMLGFLGNNVGDHLAAAVANVLADEPEHLEQAIFADEISSESMLAVRKLVAAQWKTTMLALVPELEALIEADKKAGRVTRHRVRVGLYSYHAPMPETIEDPKDS